ncbi:DNA-binding MarR family transcriptional regulator [Roseibium hamelinense]|uniref:DNA-binding MarR family transcriptional regulator n=1 Tax=Roseibium hamelinense TaxID=150831 RepID=A0A562T7E0_9HYPH|nr:MarR family transcriptional regulator [Roseibium hamelinense]MTI42843.1 MarR family transcriptional regulator [Roseibium hamelinense]TWI89511.1 DNA-binding MarR family transcriptional regulator [Roseibium hamelinense]
MYQIKEGLGFQLSYAARLIERRFEEVLSPHKLTRLMWCTLVMVDHYAITKPSDMADYLGVDRTAISRVLRSLEKAGLIDRVKSEDDGRGRDVFVTGEARAKLAALMPHAGETARHFSSKLSEAEEQELKRLLAKLSSGEARETSGI